MQAPTSYRAYALSLVLLSGFVLLLLSVVAQVGLHTYRDYLAEQRISLPTSTYWFFGLFARRPDFTFGSVILWFFWPMFLVLLRCHFRHQDDAQFAISFLFGFAGAWLILILFVLLSSFICALALIFLLSDPFAPSPFAGWLLTCINGFSWTLPLLSIAIGIYHWRNRRTVTAAV